MSSSAIGRLALLLCLLGFGLLLYQLDAKSLWVDELASVEIATRPDVGAVMSGVIEGERRPPLYHLTLHYWTALAGGSDFCLRLLSVLFAAVCLPLTFKVGAMLVGRRVGLTAAVMLAVSPTFVLYARMIRYYSLVLALGLLSCYCFLMLLERPRRRWWAGYIVSSLLLAYADYPALALLVGQNILLLAESSLRLLARNRRPFKGVAWSHWVCAQAVIALAMLPWLRIVLLQADRDLTTADLAGGPIGWLLKLAFPLYSYAIGETMLPWHAAAAIGVVAVAVLGVVGFVAAGRRAASSHAQLALLLFIALPITLTAIITSTVAPDITFVATASRSLVAAPFFFIAVATGLRQAPRRRLQVALFAMLLLIWAQGQVNYFSNIDFINPIYAVPSRAIAATVAAQQQPGDVVAADGDSAFSYYFRPAPGVASFAAGEAEAIMAHLETNASPRLWLITLGRDRTRDVAPLSLLAWLEGRYILCERSGYAEQDAIYRRAKEYLLLRPAYQFKAELALYERGACR